MKGTERSVLREVNSCDTPGVEKRRRSSCRECREAGAGLLYAFKEEKLYIMRLRRSSLSPVVPDSTCAEEFQAIDLAPHQRIGTVYVDISCMIWIIAFDGLAMVYCTVQSVDSSEQVSINDPATLILKKSYGHL